MASSIYNKTILLSKMLVMYEFHDVQKITIIIYLFNINFPLFITIYLSRYRCVLYTRKYEQIQNLVRKQRMTAFIRICVSIFPVQWVHVSNICNLMLEFFFQEMFNMTYYYNDRYTRSTRVEVFS